MGLWWIYFARSAEAAREVFTSSEDPGRLGRSAYTYFHLPMVAGIIAVAAADELTVAHPGEPGTLASIILTRRNGTVFGRARVVQVGGTRGAVLVARGRYRCADRLGTRGPCDTDARAQRRSGVDRCGRALWDTLAYGGRVRSPRRATP